MGLTSKRAETLPPKKPYIFTNIIKSQLGETLVTFVLKGNFTQLHSIKFELET